MGKLLLVSCRLSFFFSVSVSFGSLSACVEKKNTTLNEHTQHEDRRAHTYMKSLCLQQTSSQVTNAHIITQAKTALQNKSKLKDVTMLLSTIQPPSSSTDLLLYYHYFSSGADSLALSSKC
jgi:hypothetical protein